MECKSSCENKQNYLGVKTAISHTKSQWKKHHKSLFKVFAYYWYWLTTAIKNTQVPSTAPIKGSRPSNNDVVRGKSRRLGDTDRADGNNTWRLYLSVRPNLVHEFCKKLMQFGAFYINIYHHLSIGLRDICLHNSIHTKSNASRGQPLLK